MDAAIAAAMGEEANVAFVVLSFFDAGAFERCDDEGLVGDEARFMLSSLFFISVMVIVLRGLFGRRWNRVCIDLMSEPASCLENCESYVWYFS